MGSRWAWVGMLGLCACVTGCAERQGHEGGKAARATSGQSEQVEAPELAGLVGAQPGREQNTGTSAVSDTRGNPVTGTAPGNTAASKGNTATSARNTGNAQGNTAAGARTPGNAQGTAATGANTGAGATGARNTSTAQGTGAQGTSNTTASTGTGGAGRIMIGTEAVQASEDEDWFKGAARAAQAALPENTSNRSLEDVVIASSAVSGRVKRVGRDTITVRDGEGNDYVLTLDERSQGVRQGRRVSLRQLQEGTPVRAGFVLMGGRSVARDVRIRR